MPNCFCLYDKITGQRTVFQQLDAELCKYLDVPEDPDRYVNGWYDYIGLSLALGQTFDQIEQDILKWDESLCKTLMLRINHYIRLHYISDAWYEVRR